MKKEKIEHFSLEYFLAQELDIENPKKALKCYEKSAESGYIPALFKLGYFHYLGYHRFNISTNFSKAYYFFSEAAKRGSANALYYIAKMICKGNRDWSLGLYGLCLSADYGTFDAKNTIDKYHRTIVATNDSDVDDITLFTPLTIVTGLYEHRDYIDDPYERFNEVLKERPQKMLDLISNYPEFLPRIIKFLNSNSLIYIKDLNKERLFKFQTLMTKPILIHNTEFEVPQFRNEILNIILDYIDVATEIEMLNTKRNKTIAIEIVNTIVEKVSVNSLGFFKNQNKDSKTMEIEVSPSSANSFT